MDSEIYLDEGYFLGSGGTLLVAPAGTDEETATEALEAARARVEEEDYIRPWISEEEE